MDVGSLGAVAVVDDRARAVVAHELGHLRNRDVGRTYTALRAAVVVGALAVVLLVDAMSRVGSVGLAPGWRTLVLTVLTGLTMLAVLRSREHDADLRAAMWVPVGLAAAPTKTDRTFRWSWWLRSQPTV